jgi:protein translocase SecG subunit
MLNFLQLFIALFLILIVLPQTPTENYVLRKFHETGFFVSYFEAKQFLQTLTWTLLITFLILSFIIGLIN